MNQCVNANLTISENEEAVDVCEAIQTIANRAAEKAARETREEAAEKEKAAEEERMCKLLRYVQKLMEKMNQTAEQAMDFLEVAEDDRKELRRLL